MRSRPPDLRVKPHARIWTLNGSGDHVQGMGWDRGDFEVAIEQTANTAGIRRWAAEKGIEDTDHALSWLTAAHMPPESNSVEEPPEQSDYDVMNAHLFANDITHAQMSQVMDTIFNEPNFLKWMGKWDFNEVGEAIAFVNNHFRDRINADTP